MSYKSILVHIDESPQTGERILLAARLAAGQDAHLSGVAITGITQFLWQNAALEYSDPNLSMYFDVLRQRTAKTLERFKPLVCAEGVRSCEAKMMDDESSSGFIGRARCCDLVVLGQSNPQHPSPTVSRDFTESVLLHSGRPVLIVPYVGSFAQPGQKILIAWDGSVEAARAVSGALPLLKQASMVDIVVINAAPNPPAAEEPGAQLALYLKRHGVMTDVSHQRSKENIGVTLLSLACDLSSDLIVMGAYGHSRFREMLMGGATRTLLASMTVPVLMAH